MGCWSRRTILRPGFRVSELHKALKQYSSTYSSLVEQNSLARVVPHTRGTTTRADSTVSQLLKHVLGMNYAVGTEQPRTDLSLRHLWVIAPPSMRSVSTPFMLI